MQKKRLNRSDKPHPIDLRELKSPLMRIGNELDKSIPYLVRTAVKQFIITHYPDKLK